jgi:ferredoxin
MLVPRRRAACAADARNGSCVTCARVATKQLVTYVEPLHVRPRIPIVRDHPFIIRDHNKCISCGRCVAACAEIEGPAVLAFQFRNGHLTVGTHDGRPLIDTDCVSCGQCVTACPCGALDYVRERPSVFSAINDPTKVVIGFVAPAPRSVIAAKYGKSPEEASPFVAGLMRAVGFDKIFDFSFAADLTIMEETTEFLNRVRSGGVDAAVHLVLPGLGEPGREALPPTDPPPVQLQVPAADDGCDREDALSPRSTGSRSTTCTSSRSSRASPRSTRPRGQSSPQTASGTSTLC